jgi:type IV pilus assembly protein PilE
MSRCRGMTLVELLVVLAIIAILLTIGIPTYRNYILKAQRTEAMESIVLLQLKQESYRKHQISYGTLSEIGGAAASASGKYNLTVSNNSAAAYTISAAAQGGQAADSACATMSLTSSNGSVTRSPAQCWR